MKFSIEDNIIKIKVKVKISRFIKIDIFLIPSKNT
jgi:hypothetical protein